MCDNWFDNIDEFLDFSNDDGVSEKLENNNGDAGCGTDAFSKMPLDYTSMEEEKSRLSPILEEKNICEEIKWVAEFLDDSEPNIDEDSSSMFKTLSPVSVLDQPNKSEKENSSSSSSLPTVEPPTKTPSPGCARARARARSKRPRRAAGVATVPVPIVPPFSEGPPAMPTLLLAEDESLAPPLKKKKKKIALLEDVAVAIHKCLHCGIQKTPQWRAGPMGPKTLCNACGVRYKSGRLFPEYRPAASPTFVPSIHSNSHKKVVEMRNKACESKMASSEMPEYPAAKNCDLLAYIRKTE